MILSFLLSLVVFLLIWKRSENSLGISLPFLILSSGVWSLFYGLELISSNPQIINLFTSLSYVGIATIPLFWLFFAARYSRMDGWINGYSISLLFIVPIITIIMVSTNSLHYLYYSSVEFVQYNGMTLKKVEPGLFWWIHVLYSYVLFFIGFSLIVKLFFSISKEGRNRIYFIFVSSIFPFLINVLYVFGWRPFGVLDSTPIAFVIMGIAFAIGIFSSKLFDITPFAYDILFTNIPDSIFVLDNNNNIISTNPTAKILLDSTKFKDRESEFINAVNMALDIEIEGRIFSKSSTEIVSARGNKIGNLIILREETERRGVENELRSLSEMQRIIMSTASKYINININDIDSAVSKSLEEIGRFVEADRAYIFSYDWDKGIACNTHEWCAPGISPEIDNLKEVPVEYMTEWITAHKDGRPINIRDVFALPEDDTVRQTLEPQGVKSLMAIPIFEGDNCYGFVGFDSVRKHHVYTDKEESLLFVLAKIFANLNKKVELENRLIQEKENANAANRAKTEFLANISHEIRTPMNSILGFSEVMLNTSSDPKQKSYLKTILESGRTLLSLINDILDLSKIEAGRLEISPEFADIRAIAEEIKQLFVHKIEEKGIEFIIEFDSSFPRTIVIDEMRLRQILLNIVGNAIKFTEKGSVSIIVKLIEDRGGIIDFEIDIVDTGIGIAKENRDLIFDSFSQLSGIDQKKYGGTGLGLAISKRLCELMGGEISLDSEIGKGSRFTIVFNDIKYSDIQIEQDSSFVWDENIIKFKGSKILIVDDIPHNRQLVHTFLERYNLELIDAENGETSVEITKNSKPDLIFMDIRMPGMNGYEATEIIKKIPEISHIPVVALTASTMKSEIARINNLFDGYLRKPVQKRTLVNELLKFLPYIAEKDDAVIEDSVKERVSVDDISNLSKEVLDQIKSLFDQRIDTLSDSMIVTDLSILADDLKRFGQERGVTYIISKAEELEEYIDSFNFEMIQKTLKSISSIY